MICNECNNEITTLKKHILLYDAVLFALLLYIPVIKWFILIMGIVYYINKKPDRCPICGEKAIGE